MADAQDQSVTIIDPNNDGERFVFQLDKGKLLSNKIKHMFPEVVSLQYKDPVTGAKRIYSCSGKHVESPHDGWTGKMFELICRQKTTTSTSTTAQAKHGVHEEGIVVIEEPEPKEAAKKRKLNVEEVEEKHPEAKPTVDEPKVELEEGELLDDDNNAELGDQLPQAKKARLPSVPPVPAHEDLGFGQPGVVKNLIVMGLPLDLKKGVLDAYFGRFGRVEFSEIKRDGSGQSQGFGVVQLQSRNHNLWVRFGLQHWIGGQICYVRVWPIDVMEIVDFDFLRCIFIKFKWNVNFSKKQIMKIFTEKIHRFDENASITHTSKIYDESRNIAFITLNTIPAAMEFVRHINHFIDETINTIEPWKPPPGGFNGSLSHRGGRLAPRSSTGMGNSPMNRLPREHPALPFGVQGHVNDASPFHHQQHFHGRPLSQGPQDPLASGVPSCSSSMGSATRPSSNLSAAKSEATPSQMPTETVGNALKTCKTIIAGKQQQQRGNGGGQGQK